MTQPSTLNQTFDTSLVDVQQSFSSTGTETSTSSTKGDIKAAPQAKKREPSPYKTVSTDILYDQWASTYDTDGNVLQAADDIQLNDLLPQFVSKTNENYHLGESPDQPLTVLDLGCGTGRNTVKLIEAAWITEVDIVGWDGSAAMLDLARSKCEAVLDSRKRKVGVELEQVDFGLAENVSDCFQASFDGLISTLVLEHIPIETYFEVIRTILKLGSYALITNMHADMGALSQAGYKTSSGERVKGTSYIYSVQDTVQAARQAGLELVGTTREMSAHRGMFDGGTINGVVIPAGLIAERGRKWIDVNIWYGLILRKI